MTARIAGRPHAAVVSKDQLLADLRAGRVASLRRLGKAHPGAHEQRLDRGNRHREHLGELGVAHTAAARAAAARSAAARVAAGRRRSAGAATLAAPPRRSGRTSARETSSITPGTTCVGRRSSSMQRLWATLKSQARSASFAIAGPQGAVGSHEHVLQGVLGVLARSRQHLPRVARTGAGGSDRG